MKFLPKVKMVSALVAGLLVGLNGSVGAVAVTIDWIDVGDAGNLADNTVGYGSVGYDYQISKYEVTINQYTAFLNAVAATDTYNLYNTFMGSSENIKGIERSGTDGSYSYSVIADSGNRPITYVDWFDAARFSNWLTNGQATGAQDASTTETGSYALNGATSGIIVAGDGDYRLPTEDEWYKSAYYDPTKGEADDGDNYWDYAMRLDNLVDNSTSANYKDGDYATTQSPNYYPSVNYLTDVGSYSDQDSYYGTFDQSGNVNEWTDGSYGELRIRRGGGWGSPYLHLKGDLLDHTFFGYEATLEAPATGFRLVIYPR
jgi:sulfatase modifying factor 1